jgi:hypothetical protein
MSANGATHDGCWSSSSNSLRGEVNAAMTRRGNGQGADGRLVHVEMEIVHHEQEVVAAYD